MFLFHVKVKDKAINRLDKMEDKFYGCHPRSERRIKQLRPFGDGLYEVRLKLTRLCRETRKQKGKCHFCEQYVTPRFEPVTRLQIFAELMLNL